VGADPALQAVRLPVGGRPRPAGRPGGGAEPGLPGPHQLRQRGGLQQARAAARPQRLGQVDLRPLHRPRPAELLDLRRRRPLPDQLDLPGPEDLAQRHRLLRLQVRRAGGRHLRLPAGRSHRRQAARRDARPPALPHPARAARPAHAADADRRGAARRGGGDRGGAGQQRLRAQRLPPARPAVAQEPRHLRGAARQLSGRLLQSPAPRPGRALLHRPPLPRGVRHGRAAAVGGRPGAPDHRRPLGGRTARRAAVDRALRVRRRAGQRQPRPHRVLGSPQAAARGLQVPAHHRRAFERVAADRHPLERSTVARRYL
jgi:hypothetical protein